MKNQRTIIISASIVIAHLLIGCGGLSDKQRTAAQDAITALKKVEAATQVGVNYQQYGMLLIEAKDKVNQASSLLPEGELKRELTEAMDAYADAGQAWGASINGLIHTDSELGMRLIPKYPLKTVQPSSAAVHPYISFAENPTPIQIIWSEAKRHLDRAASLLDR